MVYIFSVFEKCNSVLNFQVCEESTSMKNLLLKRTTRVEIKSLKATPLEF